MTRENVTIGRVLVALVIVVFVFLVTRMLPLDLLVRRIVIDIPFVVAVVAGLFFLVSKVRQVNQRQADNTDKLGN